MINKLKNKLKKIQDKPEETKIKIIWILVAFCMIIIAGGLYFSLDLNKNARHNYNKSIFSSFPDFQKEIDNINKISKDYTALTNEIAIENEKSEIEEITKNYIEKNNYLESGNISDLKLKNIEKWKNNWHVEYEQFYKDILVYKSNVSFVVDSKEKKITSSGSNFDPNVEINDIKPKITEDEACNLITNALKNEDLDLKSSEIVIFRNIDKSPIEYYLTWKINVFSLQPLHNYVYFIDAESGKIISFYDDMI
jgi:Zn-dependent metalloprotease